MKGRTFKAVATKTYSQTEHIWKEGETVEFTAILYDSDTIIVDQQRDRKTGDLIPGSEVIAPKGSFKGLELKNEQGHVYSGDHIYGLIGPVDYKDIFQKLDDNGSNTGSKKDSKGG